MCVRMGLTWLNVTDDFYSFFWTITADSDSVTMEKIQLWQIVKQWKLMSSNGGAAESAIPLPYTKHTLE